MIRHKNRPKIWKIGFLGPSVTDEGSPSPGPIPSMVFPTVNQMACVKRWGFRAVVYRTIFSQGHVSVTYCCVTNYPLKFSGLRQQTFIISRFLWSGIWEQLSQMVLAQGLSWGWGQDVSWAAVIWRFDRSPKICLQNGRLTGMLQEPQFFTVWDFW